MIASFLKRGKSVAAKHEMPIIKIGELEGPKRKFKICLFIGRRALRKREIIRVENGKKSKKRNELRDLTEMPRGMYLEAERCGLCGK